MKLIISIFFIQFLIIGSSFSQNSPSIHEGWNNILKNYVSTSGDVNYSGLKSNDQELNKYLSLLSENIPAESWSTEKSLAYWINVYNAFTIKLILDNFPLKSIMEIDNAWDNKFISLEKKNYSLNDIEHEIIRKQFAEPRIHFALVCAAKSCPVLLNEAYTAKNLEDQLQEQARLFINDKAKNSITEKSAKLSQVFNWFKEDFTKDTKLEEYINSFSEIKMKKGAKIEFMEYDWGLNGE